MAAAKGRYERAHAAGLRGRKLPADLAEMADTDPLLDEMNDAGRSGVPYQMAVDALDPDGSRRLSTEPRAPRNPAPAPKQGRSGPVRGIFRSGHTETGASVVLGMVAYALLLSVVDHGSGGPMMWFRAKFLNQPARSAPKAASKTVVAGVVA